jgi:hypothetical protein
MGHLVTSTNAKNHLPFMLAVAGAFLMLARVANG